MHQTAGRSTDSRRGCLIILAVTFALGLAWAAAPALVREVRSRQPRPAEQEVVILVDADVFLFDWFDRNVPPTQYSGICDAVKVSMTKGDRTLTEGTTDDTGRVRPRVPAESYWVIVTGTFAGRCVR